MAKLKTPLLSLRAIGNLGQSLTFQRRSRSNLVMRKTTPTDPGSAAQLGQRAAFSACILDWHALSASDQQQWETDARRHHLTGYQFFMSDCLAVPPPPVPQLYEYYDKPPPNPPTTFGAFIWVAQTFTPQASHDITSVKLKTYNVSAPAATPVTLSVQGVDGASKPDGVDIVSLDVTAGDLGVIADTWYDFVFATNPTLTNGTMYALVLKAPTAAADTLAIEGDATTPTYPRGKNWLSFNSGVAWFDFIPADLFFEEWGLPA